MTSRGGINEKNDFRAGSFPNGSLIPQSSNNQSLFSTIAKVRLLTDGIATLTQGNLTGLNSLSVDTITVNNVVIDHITFPNLIADTAVILDSTKELTSSITTNTELSYVHGVTSSIQTQLNSKLSASNVLGTTNQINTVPSGNNVIISLADNAIFPGSGSVNLPVGTTAQRFGAAGSIRFNTDTDVFEVTTDGFTWTTVETGSVEVLSVNGTLNRIAVSPTTGHVIVDIDANYIGQSSITTVGNLISGSLASGFTPIDTIVGGTGLTSYLLGDTLYSSATNVLSKLSGNTTITKLFLSQTGNGVTSSAPIWTTINNSDLTLTDAHILVGNASNVATDVAMTGDVNIDNTGATSIVATSNATLTTLSALVSIGTITTGIWQGSVIAEIYGGTNQSSYTLGDTLYSSATNVLSKLAGNTTTTKLFLSQTGNGAISAAPIWTTISNSDLTLTDTHILVGNASNVATDVAMSGDVNIDNTGSTTIQANVVDNSKLSQANANTWKGNNTGVFNNLNDISTGTLSEITSAVLTITGGTNSVLNNISIQVSQANTMASGYLSNTDWTTFNNKMNLVSGPVNGNILLDSNTGQAIDSGIDISTDATFSGATNFEVPTALAVQTYVTNAIISGSSFRGGYDASTNLFPSTGGSGGGGAIESGNYWLITVAGTLGGTPVVPGNTVIALVNTPGQISSNWFISITGVSSVNGQTGAVSLGISDLNDVSEAGLVDSQILIWNNGTSKWTNATVSGGVSITNTGVTTVNNIATTPSVSASTFYPTFVPLNISSNQVIDTNGSFTYVPSTGVLSVNQILTSVQSYGILQGATSQPIPNNTATELTTFFTGGTNSTAGLVSTISNGRLTVSTAGIYRASVDFSWNASLNGGTGERSIWFQINGIGTRYALMTNWANGNTTLRYSQITSCLLTLSATDFVSCFCLQNSGGSLGQDLTGIGSLSLSRTM